MSSFEVMLENGNPSAVDEAVRLGPAAWPALREAAHSSEYSTRQIAMSASARLGGAEAGELLSAGLSDDNVNVRVTAANEMLNGPPLEAADAIFAALADDTDDILRETLALAAGYLSGERSMDALRPLAEDEGELGDNARAALAKLGDVAALEAIESRLGSEDALERYRALEQVTYIHARRFVERVRNLLSDRESAVMIGTLRNPRFRRVCDQAVDTLSSLLDLSLEFSVSAEILYSDQEISQVMTGS